MGVTVSEDFCVMVRQPVSILHLLGVGHRLALRLSVFADPEVDGRTPLCTVLLGCGDHNLVSRSQLDAGRVSGRHAVRQLSMQPSDTLPYARAAVLRVIPICRSAVEFPAVEWELGERYRLAIPIEYDTGVT